MNDKIVQNTIKSADGLAIEEKVRSVLPEGWRSWLKGPDANNDSYLIIVESPNRRRFKVPFYDVDQNPNFIGATLTRQIASMN